MHVGLLTARFGRDRDLESIAVWAAETGFKALEVACGPGAHIDPGKVLADDGAAVKRILDETGIGISSLAGYTGFNRGEGPDAYSKMMRDALAAAEILGVGVVCTLAGFCEDGMSKLQTIRERAAGVFEPLARDAEKRGVKIAFENWFATNLQNLDHFRAIAEIMPANVGFNFDPSHLFWQGIDHVAAVEEFADRIFHTHAKDTLVRPDVRARVGVLERAWWQYVIPGFGDIRWGKYIRTLKLSGYDGVLSIEHEDDAFGAEEGFEKGLRYLSTLV